MTAKRRVGILTGGGDVPGLNVAIKAVVSRAEDGDIEVVGLRRGWLSVVEINPDDPETREEWTMPLTPDSVRTIDRTGGTILHTSRINPAKVKPDEVPTCVRAEDRVATPDGAVDCTRHVLRVLDFLGLEAIIPIGGAEPLRRLRPTPERRQSRAACARPAKSRSSGHPGGGAARLVGSPQRGVEGFAGP